MKNIVLIGMPGSGKSSVGRRLAKKLRMPLVDTDDMVVEREHRPISEIFATEGEAYFRKVETACVKEAAAQMGIIIATGGGVVLRKENVEALRKSGVVFFLDRSPRKIMARSALSDRPLVQQDKSRLLALYNERFSFYQAAAHVRIPNQGHSKQAVLKIAQEMKKWERSQ